MNQILRTKAPRNEDDASAPADREPIGSPAQSAGISVMIMTFNEEANLPACLESLSWCDDIVVLDSFSSDRTVEIAKAAGARVYQYPRESELKLRLYMLTEISYKHPWVYT